MGDALLDAQPVLAGVIDWDGVPDTVVVRVRDTAPLPLPPTSEGDACGEELAPLDAVPPPPTLADTIALAEACGQLVGAGDVEGAPEGDALAGPVEGDEAREGEVESDVEGVSDPVIVAVALVQAAAEGDASANEGDEVSDVVKVPLAVAAVESEALPEKEAVPVRAVEELGLPDAPSEAEAPLLPLGLPVRNAVSVAPALNDAHAEDDGEREGLPEAGGEREDDGEREGLPEADGERKGEDEGGEEGDVKADRPVEAVLCALPEAPDAVGAPAVALIMGVREPLREGESDGCSDVVDKDDAVGTKKVGVGITEPVTVVDVKGVPDCDPPSLGLGSGERESAGEPLNTVLALPLLLVDGVESKDTVAPPGGLPLLLSVCVAQPLLAAELLPKLVVVAVAAALEGVPKEGDALAVVDAECDAVEAPVPDPPKEAVARPTDAVAPAKGDGVEAEDAEPAERVCKGESDGDGLFPGDAVFPPLTLPLPLWEGAADAAVDTLVDPVPEAVAEAPALNDGESLARTVAEAPTVSVGESLARVEADARTVVDGEPLALRLLS